MDKQIQQTLEDCFKARNTETEMGNLVEFSHQNQIWFTVRKIL